MGTGPEADLRIEAPPKVGGLNYTGSRPKIAQERDKSATGSSNVNRQVEREFG
jgi:hypothetical protein